MKLLSLQIIATLLSLTGGVLLIFKRKNGWLFQTAGIIILMIINYYAELYFLIIPCIFSVIVTLVGWFKWRNDERKVKEEINERSI